MERNQWLYSLLKDIIAFAAINEMQQVARHTAEALYALELHEYDGAKKMRIVKERLINAFGCAEMAA